MKIYKNDKKMYIGYDVTNTLLKGLSFSKKNINVQTIRHLILFNFFLFFWFKIKDEPIQVEMCTKKGGKLYIFPIHIFTYNQINVIRRIKILRS